MAKQGVKRKKGVSRPKTLAERIADKSEMDRIYATSAMRQQTLDAVIICLNEALVSDR